MNFKIILSLKLLFLFSFFVIKIGYANLIQVPSQQPTIQAGINTANNGDTVLVDQGVYIENINLNGKPITVASNFIFSSDPLDISNTIIDGNQNGSVVTIANNEDSTTVLCGFTIRNGNATATPYDQYLGGGIFIEYAHPLLKNLRVTGNSAFTGAGIYLSHSSSKMFNIQVLENDGNGVWAEDSDIELINIQISSNKEEGFQCFRTTALLSNGKIKNNGNTNYNGGGINCSQSSTVKLSGLTICNNSASYSGGGIYCHESQVIFDESERCNVYLNNASTGCDISSYNSPTISVIVDTFSVISPDEYFASPFDKFSFDINFPKIIPVDADLYVSPDGSNLYSGLSPDVPLKTIRMALLSILADEENPHTIYLSDGIYSPQSNGEFFPVSLKGHVSLIGTSEDSTILDANNKNTVLYCSDIDSLDIKDMTIRNGNFSSGSGGGIYINNSSPHLENITVTDNYASDAGGIFISYYSHPILDSITVRNNSTDLVNSQGTHVGGGGIYIGSYCNPVLNNIIIEGNIAQKGAGIRCNGYSYPQISNTTIRNNTASLYGGGLYVWKEGHPTLENVIIQENEATREAGGIYSVDSDFSLNKVSIIENTTLGEGGGIFAENSTVNMKRVTIKNNKAGNDYSRYGGGIYCDNSQFNFNPDSLCNIYFNEAGFGNEIYSNVNMSVIVDTFTVLKPTSYYAYPRKYFSFDIDHSIIHQVEGDVFVSPGGNDNNTGMTSDSPLKTIDHALSIIYADSLNRGIIHLAEGTYSSSSNQENLPVTAIDYTELSGQNKNSTFIDGQNSARVLYLENIKGVQVDNLCLKNGYMSTIYLRDSDIEIYNTWISGSASTGIYANSSELLFDNCNVDNNSSGIEFYNSEAVIMNSVIEKNNKGMACNSSSVEIEQSHILENKNNGLLFSDNSIFTLNETVIGKNGKTGIKIMDSEANIKNVLIYSNLEGGINSDNSLLDFAGVTIKDNVTRNKGGGIFFTNNSTLNFNLQNPCNIYSNKAGIGKDLFNEGCGLTIVYLDTFTVYNVGNYFAAPIDSFVFTIQTGKIPQIDGDLFVSTDGDDSHEGTSPAEPLKTIDMALTKIIADSGHPRIITLGKGIYSKSVNDDFLPVSLRDYVSLTGDKNGLCILDAENSSRVLNGFNVKGACVKNMVLKNGISNYGAGANITSSNMELDNVHIDKNMGTGLYSENADINFYKSIVSGSAGAGIESYHSRVDLLNATIVNNGGIYFDMDYFSLFLNNSDIYVVNSIIWGNAYNHWGTFTQADSHYVVITHSDIQDSISALIYFGKTKFKWLANNKSSDPLFKNIENSDFSLNKNSPCIDAGTPFFSWKGDTLLNVPSTLYIGTSPDLGAIEFDPTGIYEDQPVLSSLHLYQNYPNPFNSRTVISYYLPKISRVKLSIYNILGQKIYSLSKEQQREGNHKIIWNATGVSSGIYYYKLEAGESILVKKCILVK
jgi:predicted outer membrane repeat protein